MEPVTRIVRVAAVQATPVILDAAATIEKAAGLIARAADLGAELAVLPECFVSLYPGYAWVPAAMADPDADERLYQRFWEESIEVPGPAVDRLAEACRDANLYCVIGVNEREQARSGTVFNTMLVLGPPGLLHKHRKLMPTKQERLFHGFGDGTDLVVVETPLGRLGGLTCWENRMPLARYALYRQRPQIWAAPTMDTSEGWLPVVRNIAIEAGVYVVSVPQLIPRAAFPDDFPIDLPGDEDRVFNRGGAVIVDPVEGAFLAGPLWGEEGILIADCDLGAGLRAKSWFDVAGHYSREDVLVPLLAGSSALPEVQPASLPATPSPAWRLGNGT
jgi:nitrilase